MQNKKAPLRFFILSPYFYFLPIKNETTATTITAPIIEGTSAIPAKLGPHEPSKA
jgi:hypothetical protein